MDLLGEKVNNFRFFFLKVGNRKDKWLIVFFNELKVKNYLGRLLSGGLKS